jgi:hypothetical protein
MPKPIRSNTVARLSARLDIPIISIEFSRCSRHPARRRVTFYPIEPRMEAASTRKDVIKRFWNIRFDQSAIAGPDNDPQI